MLKDAGFRDAIAEDRTDQVSLTSFSSRSSGSTQVSIMLISAQF
jgi:hypothetical protein